jgi:uncharacterized membrane protein YfcA
MTLLFLGIGLVAGLSAGFFGVGGGILIVPALTFLAGFTQERAIGTSLAVLLPPVGLMAVIEYYRHGNVDLKAGALVAVGLILGAWLGAFEAHKLPEVWLKMSFGIFVTLVGIWIVLGALKGFHVKGI